MADKLSDNISSNAGVVSNLLQKSKIKEINSSDVLKTKLNPADEAKFQEWKSKLPKNLQYEGDYDLKGLFKDNPNVKPSANLHFPDTYKLPNHRTFSNESKYFNPSTKDIAGHWIETDKAWNYVPYNSKLKAGKTELK